MVSGNRNADRPNVAIGILEHDVAPSVGKIRGGLKDFCTSCLRASMRSVGIDAEDTQFRASSARAWGFQSFERRMVVVGMIGMKHEVDALQVERCEIVVTVADGSEEHVAVEGKRLLNVPYEQVYGEFRERSAVRVGRHPRIAGSGFSHEDLSF